MGFGDSELMELGDSNPDLLGATKYADRLESSFCAGTCLSTVATVATL